jgi:carnitine O-acetyltransferase
MSSTNDKPAMIPSDTSLTKSSSLPNGDKSKAAGDLPKLPLPKLEDTCRRYLRALEALQDEEEHEKTKGVVMEFLESGEGAKWHRKLEEYNDGVDSYIEEFWYESYLSFADSVVLSLVSRNDSRAMVLLVVADTTEPLLRPLVSWMRRDCATAS